MSGVPWPPAASSCCRHWRWSTAGWCRSTATRTSRPDWSLEGKLRLRIGDEERELAPGDAFLIPGHVVHSGVVTEGPARVLDIFSPVREDYVNRYNRFTGTGSDTRWHDK